MTSKLLAVVGLAESWVFGTASLKSLAFQQPLAIGLEVVEVASAQTGPASASPVTVEALVSQEAAPAALSMVLG